MLDGSKLSLKLQVVSDLCVSSLKGLIGAINGGGFDRYKNGSSSLSGDQTLDVNEVADLAVGLTGAMFDFTTKPENELNVVDFMVENREKFESISNLGLVAVFGLASAAHLSAIAQTFAKCIDSENEEGPSGPELGPSVHVGLVVTKLPDGEFEDIGAMIGDAVEHLKKLGVMDEDEAVHVLKALKGIKKHGDLKNLMPNNLCKELDEVNGLIKLKPGKEDELMELLKEMANEIEDDDDE